MTIAKDSGRQGVIRARVDVVFGDLAGEDVEQSQTIAHGALTTATPHASSIALPVGAVLVSGSVTIVTPFNSQTSDVLDVGDASAGDRYLNDADLTQAGGTVIPLVPTGFVVTAGEPAIDVTWTKVGTAATVGAFTIEVAYVIPQPAGSVQVPHGAIVVGGALVVTEEFDSSVSDTLTVGDSASPGRYKSGIDGQTAALTALVPTGHEVTLGGDITVTLTRLGAAPSAGAATLFVDYIVAGRAQFSQG